MVCLGFKPREAGWKMQMNQMSYRGPPLLEYNCISSSSAATVLVISQYNTVVACSLATPDVTLKLGGEETTILSMGNSHSQGLPSQLNLTHHRPRRNKPSQTSYSR